MPKPNINIIRELIYKPLTMENLPERLPVLSQELSDEDFRRVLEETPQPSTSQQVPEFDDTLFNVPQNPQIYDPVSPPDPPYHIEVDESPVTSPNQNYHISQPASPIPVPEIIISDDESQNRTPRPNEEFIVADVTKRGQIQKNKRKMSASAVTSVKRKCDGVGRRCDGFRRDKVRGGRLVRGDNRHAGDVAQVPAVNAPQVRQDAPQVPAVDAPQVPAVDAPQVPAVDAPQVPAVDAPQVPAVDAPVARQDPPQVRRLGVIGRDVPVVRQGAPQVRRMGVIEKMYSVERFWNTYKQKFLIIDEELRQALLVVDRIRAKKERLENCVSNRMRDLAFM